MRQQLGRILRLRKTGRASRAAAKEARRSLRRSIRRARRVCWEEFLNGAYGKDV